MEEEKLDVGSLMVTDNGNSLVVGTSEGPLKVISTCAAIEDRLTYTGENRIGYLQTSLDFESLTEELKYDKNVLGVLENDVFMTLADDVTASSIIGWTLISRRTAGDWKSKRFKYGFKTSASAWLVEMGIFVESNNEETLIYASPEYSSFLGDREDIEEAVDKILGSRETEEDSDIEKRVLDILKEQPDGNLIVHDPLTWGGLNNPSNPYPPFGTGWTYYGSSGNTITCSASSGSTAVTTLENNVIN